MIVDKLGMIGTDIDNDYYHIINGDDKLGGSCNGGVEMNDMFMIIDLIFHFFSAF